METPLVFRFLAATALLLSGLACSPNGSSNVLRDYTGSSFQPGQVWQYHTRPGEDASTLTVLKVETHPKSGIIVHIAVSGVRVRTPSGDYTTELGHLPLSEDALRRSVTTKVREGQPTDRGTEGYREWRRAFDDGSGGVFTTTVAECVGFVEQAASQARKQ
jgi:hypothetical protein